MVDVSVYLISYLDRALGWHPLTVELLSVDFDVTPINHNRVAGNANHTLDPSLACF